MQGKRHGCDALVTIQRKRVDTLHPTKINKETNSMFTIRDNTQPTVKTTIKVTL